MRIVALADTHIKSGSLIECLPGELVELIKKADMVIHAGDFVTKQAYEELEGICRLEAVQGNMDEPVLKRLLPEQKVIEIEGISTGIVHEAALSLHDTTGAYYLAKEMNVDVLVFGHLHKPVIESNDVLLACPGSPTYPRLSEPSAIEFNIEGNKVSGKIITFEKAKCESLAGIKHFTASY